MGEMVSLAMLFGFMLGMNVMLFYVWVFQMAKEKRKHLLDKLCTKCRETYILMRGKGVLG